jgi:Tol biopolymer transport system component
MNRSKAAILAGVVLGVALACWPAVAQAHVVERVSVATGCTQGQYRSYFPSLSADGRYVAFISAAGDLVPGDTNGCDDVFVRDRQSGTTERVSIATDGTQANDHCGVGGVGVAISADGRYVAFPSDASNLVAGDTNARRDAFVRDRQAGTTVRASVSSAEAQGNLSRGSRSISGDGRYVAFVSYATNLVPGDTNGQEDVFVRDLVAGTTTRVNMSAGGAQANAPCSLSCALSDDGHYVGFESGASNLVTGDTNGNDDVFVAVNRLDP